MDLLKTLKKTFVFLEACLEDLQRAKHLWRILSICFVSQNIMIDGRQEHKIMLDKFFTLKITYYLKA